MDGKLPPRMVPVKRSVEGDRPSMTVRAVSSPVLSQTPTSKHTTMPRYPSMLTPPSSPPRDVSSSNDLKMDYENLEDLRSSIDAQRRFTYSDDGIILCPFYVQYVADQRDRKQVFGYGAWSTVFKGTCHPKQSFNHGLMTPPSQSTLTPPLLVAVKCPARKDAIPILRNEALTLSRLRELDVDERYIATFYGVIDDESSLILAAHPLSLEEHVKDCASIAKSTMTTDNMTSPVLGSAAIWLSLAKKLITALDWMHHEASVVHGDIKPGNILLQLSPDSVTKDGFPYQPLFIDFSSSQRLDIQEVTPNTLSAITKEYTAPELLSVAVLRDPESCATAASDVFSLAVTLLVAATGDPMVYTGYSAMQRQMLATQGWAIIENVRSLSSRVPRHGVVSRLLERAVLKKDMGRISTSVWKQVVNDTELDTSGQCSKM